MSLFYCNMIKYLHIVYSVIKKTNWISDKSIKNYVNIAKYKLENNRTSELVHYLMCFNKLKLAIIHKKKISLSQNKRKYFYFVFFTIIYDLVFRLQIFKINKVTVTINV